ncbi:MAG: hypothetical protein RIC55_30210 [Pirellulaceae bacterium]
MEKFIPSKAAAVIAALLLFSPGPVSNAPASSAQAEECQCKTHCPRCNVICVPSREIENETKTEFDVSCKWICVPKVRFPWEPCCQPKCAWVRKVKELEKIEYECPHCKYKWTAMCKCGSCLSCPSGQCTQTHGGPPPMVDPDAPPLPPTIAPEGRQTSFDEPSRPLLAPFIRFFRKDESR